MGKSVDDDAASSPAVRTHTGIKRTCENTARGAETPFFWAQVLLPVRELLAGSGCWLLQHFQLLGHERSRLLQAG